MSILKKFVDFFCFVSFFQQDQHSDIQLYDAEGRGKRQPFFDGADIAGIMWIHS